MARKAVELAWTRDPGPGTRDPFDRLLVAQAALDGARLVTKNRVIRNHYAASVW